MNQQSKINPSIKVLAGAALIAVSGVAIAADFEGSYFGLSGGLSEGKTTTSRSLVYRSPPPGGNAANLLQQQNMVASTGQGLKTTDFTGGAQVGYNWRSGNVVFGLEFDANYLSLKRSSTASTTFVTTNGNATKSVTANDSEDSSWVATLRPRIGYLVTEKSLVYVTGGFAFSDQKFNNSTTIAVLAGGGCGPGTYGAYASNGSKASGSVWGAGYEYAWSKNMNVKAEYQHLRFGNSQAQGANSSAFCAVTDLTGSTVTTNSNVKADVLRVGVNWKF